MENKLIQKIKLLIAEDKIKLAIKGLESAAKMFFPITRLQLIRINNRLNRVERDYLSGTITYDKRTIHKNKIVKDLLYILDTITHKRNVQYIHWVLWVIALICGGLIYYSTMLNTQGLKVEKPIITNEQILYTIHKLEAGYNQYDLRFTLPEGERAVKLNPHMTLVKEDGRIVETKELLSGENLALWEKRQGIKVHLPERKGIFKLIIPINKEAGFTPSKLKYALTIKNDFDSRSGYEDFQWQHQLLSTFGNWILKITMMIGMVISFVIRFLFKL